MRPSGRLPELTDHVALLADEVSRAVYVFPAVPFGTSSVVIVIPVGVLIVMLSSFSALFEPDVAFTVNVDVPAAVGVPEIVPELLSVSPAGRLPEAIDHVTADELTASTAEYDAFTVPAGRLIVVILRLGPPVIVILSSLVALTEPDTALTVNVDVPAVVGVPEIVPELLSVSPAGRLPEAIDHVTAEESAASMAEYDALTVPDGRLVVVILIAGPDPFIVMLNSFDTL